MMTYEKQENNYIWAWFKAGQNLSRGGPSPALPPAAQRGPEARGEKEWSENGKSEGRCPLSPRWLDGEGQCSGAIRWKVRLKTQYQLRASERRRDLFRRKHVCEETWGKVTLAVNTVNTASLLLVLLLWPMAPCGRLFQVLSSFLCGACLCAIRKPLCQLASKQWTEWLSWQGEQQQHKNVNRVGLKLSCNDLLTALFSKLPHGQTFHEGTMPAPHQFLTDWILFYLDTCGCRHCETCLF